MPQIQAQRSGGVSFSGVLSLHLTPPPPRAVPAGFEQRQDSSKSNAYSASVMENTVRWAMLDQLSSPPAYFADCIHAHFQQRGDAVLATVRKWVGWCQETGHQSQATNIEKMLPQLEQHIAKLKA